MNLPTTRSTTPAAPARTGPWVAALPNDPGLDEILADPRLGATAKTIVIAMVRNWARFKDSCWPSDQTIAKKIGKSVGHVRRCLRQLELAGYIHREKTGAVSTGRRIWLLWRHPKPPAGARPERAPVHPTESAPARTEQVVVVNGRKEPEIPCASPRQRPEPESLPVPVISPEPAVVSPPVLPTNACPALPAQSRMTQEPPEAPWARPVEPPAGSIAQALDGLASGLLANRTAPVCPETPVPTPAVLDRLVTKHPALAPPEVREATPSKASPGPSLSERFAPRRRVLGLNLAELAAIVDQSADPIIAKELARRTAPPPPPEPFPQTLPTSELFANLPGRHDLIAAATRRLTEETQDCKAASWLFFQKAVEAVVTRRVPPDVLLDCRRQATGPKAKNRGKVFVTAWKREVEVRRRY